MDGGDLAAIHDVRTLRSDGDRPLGETAGGSRKGKMTRGFGLRANNQAAENLFPAEQDFCDGTRIAFKLGRTAFATMMDPRNKCEGDSV